MIIADIIIMFNPVTIIIGNLLLFIITIAEHRYSVNQLFMIQNNSKALDSLKGWRGIFKKFRAGIINLFSPEEVEVTFKSDGNRVSYTYTKVEHKRVA